jgi:PAS domain S-box-containing protein/putative nucleotidyltransferase with HDIG domain
MQRDLKHNYNILCIDDNESNLFTLNALLSTVENIKSTEVLSAKDALDVLLTQHIDLILCDVQMPDINGFEFAKMIKSSKKTKDIPIIFVTAVFKSEEFIQEGFAMGAVDYVTKPIDDNQLLNKIKLYLKIFDEKNKLLRSEKLLYDVAQSIGDGVYTLDENDRTTFINKEALNLLGFTANELMGKKIHDYIHYKDIENKKVSRDECNVHKSMQKGDVYESDNEYLIRKDGSFISVSLLVTPLYIENHIVGTVTVFKDKTKQNIIDNLEHEKMKNQEQIIYSMIDMIESRDSYTAGHTKRVAEYSILIAKEMNYSKDEIELLKNAAWLHDIGKISTPDSVLLKPSKLNNTEYALIKEHLSSGYEMLSKIDQYKDIADVMREHHEKYDGSGYPRGLKADEIKPLSRIMMVADAFDAMTTNRVYKPRKTVEVALKELKELSEKHFHPEVVDAALVALKDINISNKISQLPQTSIEEQRFSYFYKDRLTNLFIVDYLSLIIRYHIKTPSAYMYDVKLHNFTEYNSVNSWSDGDKFLVKFANILENLYSDSVVFRVEGDDFMILSEKRLTSLEEDLKKYDIFKNSIITFSVHEKFIEDVYTLIPS